MTVRELKEIMKIHDDIKAIDERIEEIRTRIESPKNQIISDMPRGGSSENVLEKALVKIERLETRKMFLHEMIVSKWHICEDFLNSCNIPDKQMVLMQYRYFYGLPWSKCVKEMKNEYPDEMWNENKVFRLHRQTITKIHKKQF